MQNSSSEVDADLGFPPSWTQALCWMFDGTSPMDQFWKRFLANCKTIGGSLPSRSETLPADQCLPLLPMSLPFPQAEGELLFGQLPSSARRRKRGVIKRTAMRWANRLIACFNFFEFGPLGAQRYVAAHRPAVLSVQQAVYAGKLVEDLLEWARLPLDLSSGWGSGQKGKVQQLASAVAAG